MTARYPITHEVQQRILDWCRHAEMVADTEDSGYAVYRDTRLDKQRQSLDDEASDLLFQIREELSD